jgi:hypothetical protein
MLILAMIAQPNGQTSSGKTDISALAASRLSAALSSAAAVLGAGSALQLGLAAYTLGNRATTLGAIAWQGDAMICALMASTVWYVAFSAVRGLGGNATAVALAAAAWMGSLLALWLPEMGGFISAGESKVVAMPGKSGAPTREVQRGRLRLVLAALPIVAVGCSMPLKLWLP